MLPTRYPNLFRSRWRAIWWSLGVCISAVMFVGFAPSHPDAGVGNDVATSDSPADNPDVRHLEDLVANFEQ